MLRLTKVGSVLRVAHVFRQFTGMSVRAVGSPICAGLRALGRGVVIAACPTLTACAATPTSTPSGKPDEAYAKAAWAYFKNKCVTEAGEKIYKTFTGVKSVLIVKPLPPATDKDHFDQFWYGDPYSLPATSNRVVRAAGLLTLGSRKDSHIYRGLQFVEFRDDTGGKLQYRKVSSPQDHNDFYVENIEKPISSYGVSWDDISTPEDRKYWIAGSRLRVIDLASNSTIAERIGYFIEAGFGSNAGGRRPWLTSRGPQTTCPPLHGDYTDQQFVSKLFGLREEK